MWTRQHKPRNTGKLIVPALCVAFLSYFGFHAYNGQYGIYAKYRYEEQAAVLQKQLDMRRAERMDIERRVRLVHDGSMQRDMLDEQARRALNVSKPDEVTIMRTGRTPY
ncbi:septum formation initiator family protein [Corticibacterium sp. UT-5YL-CI-8]|nr:septum formation initiator family protein [Tianweitania sp. UT-5YL-CI-8]